MTRRPVDPPALPYGATISRRALLANLAAACVALAAGCSPAPVGAPTTPSAAPADSGGPLPPATSGPPTAAPIAAAATAGACTPAPIIAPTPAPYPGYTQIDASGLHVTAEAQIVDPVAYRLEVTGKVDHPLSLSLDELRCLPKVEADVRLVCPGFFVDNSHYAGARLADVLAQAGPRSGVNSVALRAAGGFTSMISLTEAQAPENLLAYEWEGQPLPVLHGFPVRGVFPSLEGGRWPKWVMALELT